MQLEAGRTYRAKTSAGDQITFVVISNAGDVWPLVNLDSADGQGRQRGHRGARTH